MPTTSAVPAADSLRAYLMGAPPVCCGTRPCLPEGLVDVRREAPSLVLLPAPPWCHAELRFLVHADVAGRLRRAAASLPDGIRLGFWEGLRPVSVQRALWDTSLEFLRRTRPELSPGEVEAELELYVARPDASPCGPPPHSTGSAVDVAPVDAYGRVMDPSQPWGLLGVREMSRVLREAGLAGYEVEWWHWSYGDLEWARANECDPLPFALTEPAGETEGPGAGI